MRSRLVHIVTWLLGVLGVVAVVIYFQPQDFAGTLRSVGAGGALAWLLLTLAARFLLIETTVRPLAVLGHTLRRRDAFWIGWIRSFTNQLLPLAGLAVYAQQVRRLTGSSWSDIASLSSPQLLLAAAALGVVGAAATLAGQAWLGSAMLPLFIAFAAIVVTSLLLANNVAGLVDRLPRQLATRARQMSESFRRLADQPGLPAQLVALHVATILLRGSRLWALFFASGLLLGWQEALLLVAISEAAALVQLTPGGLGLREGAIVGAALVLGIPAEAGAAIALLDRLFIVSATMLFTAPALLALRRA